MTTLRPSSLSKLVPFTLLNNFSAAIIAKTLQLQGFSKEFYVNVEDNQRLNITFIPSPTSLDAYAFINGIEVVSMHANPYYTATENRWPVKVIGDLLTVTLL